MRILAHGLGLAWPPALFLALTWGILEGPLSFGGGEKDVILLFPLALFVLLYWLLYAVSWWRGTAAARAARGATIYACAVIIALGLALILLNLAGFI